MGYKIFSKIFTRKNLFKDLDKILVADLSDTTEIYKCNLTLQDLSKILLAYPKISSSCLQDVSLGRTYQPRRRREKREKISTYRCRA